MYRRYAKRPIDTIAALTILVVLFPIAILVAIIIRATSGTPIVFRQKRTGLHGEDFTMFKYRTMHSSNNLHDTTTANQMTSVGKIIRGLSLDEVPQLVNIVKGEMSFIGPRPWIPEYYQHMTEEQRKRTSVRPGITGVAQARGRNNLDVFDKINCDLLYIQNITFVNDVKIVILTILALFEKTGAAIEKHAIHYEINTLKLQHGQPTLATNGVFFSELKKSKKDTDRIKRNDNATHSVDGNKDLVSIIVPVYNAERFLEDTIATVKNQTYTNWELILIDDCSTDNSVQIIQKYQKDDTRIKLLKNSVNSYAALTRNKGIDESKGRYIAFLDADDLLEPTKLEKQVQFMQQKDCAFSFTGYEFADEQGRPNGKKVSVPTTITYKQALKNTTIWTSTVMLDANKLTKQTMHMPNVKRGQDTATWWKILKTIDSACGFDEVLSYYRRTSDSLSANKFIALKRTWFLYRKIERISLSKAFYLYIFYLSNAVRRRV